ncbi:MAG TPA: DUF4349 domain-containing protein [Candidatus Acidoferrum sp.]|jgi:hypothetical protein
MNRAALDISTQPFAVMLPDWRAMKHKYLTLIVAGFFFSSTGCEKFAHPPRAFNDRGLQTVAFTGQTQAGTAATTPTPSSAQRFIAETDQFDVIASGAELQKAFESLVAFCPAIQCEVVSSNMISGAEDSVPSAKVVLRVAPQDANKLFNQLRQFGKIAQHTTQREDKTTAVIDTEARIKNLATFRDNLRAMLAKPSARVEDLIQIQQQLMETQSQLDSETAQRKVLANETEKIAVEVTFRVQYPAGSSTGFRQVWSALRESVSVLAGSIAALITVVVAVVPWLILIVPLCWLARTFWRRSRRNRAVAQPSAAITG